MEEYQKEIMEVSDFYCWKSYSSLPSGEINPPAFLMAWPIINRAVREIAESDELSKFPDLRDLFRDEVTRFFHINLTNHFVKIFVYEVNFQSKNKLLIGDCPETRYKSFIETLKDPLTIKTYEKKYSVLYDRINIFVGNTVEFILEFISKLHHDLSEIENEFQIDIKDVETIDFASGDPHNSGKSTIVLKGEKGGIVYKPREMQADILYEKILLELSQDSDCHLMHIPTINKSTYGWQKYIIHNTLADKDKINAYFKGIGFHLAISYLLNLSDIHHENIISDDMGTPYIVDLESIFNNHDITYRSDGYLRNTSAEKAAVQLLESSVMQTGLLPLNVNFAGKFSGSSIEKEAESPVEVDTFINFERDDLKIIKKRVKSPLLTPIRSVNWSSEDTGRNIKLGFEVAYQGIINKRTNIEKLIREYTPRCVRHIVRPTYLYMTFLNETTNPLAASSKDQYLKVIEKLAYGQRYKPEWGVLLHQEAAQLYQFDIPAFYADPLNRSLYAEKTKFDEFFKSTAFEHTIRKLNSFSSEDMNSQLGMIDACFDIIPKYGSLADSSKPNIAFVNSILSEIDARKVTSGESVTWLTKVDNSSRPIEVVDDSIYNGTSGLLILFTMAFKSGLSEYKELCRSIASKITYKIEHGYLKEEQGFFSGRQGALWALTQYANICDNSEIKNYLQDNASLFKPEYGDIPILDLLDGLSGVLLSITDIGSSSKSEEHLSVAHEIFEDICNALSTGHYHLIKKNAIKTPLGGFSHGYSGIAHALFTYGKAFRVTKAIELANELLHRESKNYSLEFKNWPDLRTGEPVFSATWCNGAIGYLVTRAVHWEFISENEKTLFKYTFEQLMVYRDFKDETFCHGRAGIINGLITIKQSLKELTPSIDEYIKNSIETLKGKEEWGLGWEHYPNNFGFMVGTAGLAYMLLRIENPNLPDPLSIMSFQTLEHS